MPLDFERPQFESLGPPTQTPGPGEEPSADGKCAGWPPVPILESSGPIERWRRRGAALRST